MDMDKAETHLAWAQEGIKFLGEQGKDHAMKVKSILERRTMKICCAFCKENTIECEIPAGLFDGEKEFAFVENFLLENGWSIQGDVDECYWDCGQCFDEDDLEELD